MTSFNGVVAMPYEPAATQSASALNATTPLGNINDDSVSRIVEVTGTEFVVDFDLGSAAPVNTIAALFTNAATDTTWEIRAADDEAGLDAGTIVVPAGTGLHASQSSAKAKRPHGIWFGEAVTHRWWRIRITFGSASPFRIGRLVLADGLQPFWNYQLPVRETPADTILEDQTRSGRKVKDVIAYGRRIQLRFGELSEAEYYDYARPINDAAAKRKALMIMNPRDDYAYRQDGIYFGDLVVVSDKLPSGEWAASITLTENR